MTRQLLPILLAISVSCGTPAKRPVAEVPLALSPIVNLVPAAGLNTLVVVRPKDLYACADLLPALGVLLPSDQVEIFSSRHGGIDPRVFDEIVVATFPHSTLALARGFVSRAAIEKSFGERTLGIEGRAVDQPGGALTSIVRIWGSSATNNESQRHQEVAIFGGQAVGWELEDEDRDVNKSHGPLRVAELFALKKLAKAKPALLASPLAATAKLLGEGPLRIFFPGPFDGEWSTALGGLLKAATSVAMVATPDDKGNLRVTVVITGAFGDKSPEAAIRLSAAADLFRASALGRLAGFDHPVIPVSTRSTPEAAILEVTVEALALARGMRAATGAEVTEIMNY